MKLDIAYYADDFTGSTDVLETLSAAGLETVLFLRQPESEWLSRFGHCRGLGLAGISRSQTPEWMDANLPGAFEWLRGLEPRICHYKVCSTFDSSPRTGSIGRAIEIGRRVFGVRFVPVVVGMPSLRRYVVFGNLFASVGEETFRIDRHPTMSRHPVTPMDEGDLRVHLAKQTELPIALLDLFAVRAANAGERFRRLVEGGASIVLFDSLDEDSLLRAGNILWDEAPHPRAFLAGSSGVEYALVSCWRSRGLLPAEAERRSLGEVERLAVLSGSFSPVTEAQIRWSERNGWAAIGLDVAKLAGGARDEKAVTAACDALSGGRSVVLYSACGHGDKKELDARGREALAKQSGLVLDAVLARSGVRRAVIAGGDTSSHAGPQLGLYALTYEMPVAPGAPICRGYSESKSRDGLEVVFKGGQCGTEDFFERVRRG